MSHALHFAHQRAVRTIRGVVVRCRLAPIGSRIDVVHSELDPALPAHSIRVRVGGGEMLIDSTEWVGRHAELDEHVIARLLEHLDLRAARRRPAARRHDEVWMRARREANPGRR